MTVTFSPYILHFKEPAGTSRGVYRERRVWYITVTEPDTPYFGIGECAPLPNLSCDDVPEYPEVIGRACRKLSETEEIPYQDLQDFPSILFGMETAMRSFRASQTGLSPYHLFDNTFSRGEAGITINGLVWMGTYDEMLKRMQCKVEQGFRCVKIKVGAIDWQRELDLIRVLRSHFTADTIELRLDANGGFTADNALQRLHELSSYDIHSIEQPIRQHQWQAMAELCRKSPIPIALDEELIGVNTEDAKCCLLDTIHPQYIILKPSLHGGIRGCEDWIKLAKARNVGYWMTSALESNVGLNAIAQWCGDLSPMLPQGLGTGMLFTDNTSAPQLDIIDQQLWCSVGKARQDFAKDLETFLREWSNKNTVLQVFTSGSTGNPRPITVEKQQMTASAEMTLRYLNLRPGDSALLCMPLKYIAGKMMVVRAIVGGLRLISEPPSSHPLRTIAQTLSVLPSNYLDTHPDLLPTFLALTPMQAWNTLQNADERAIFCRIPRIIIGGGAISSELHTALQGCQGEVYSTYGMTETLSHIALRRLNGLDPSDWYTPLPGVTLSLNSSGCLVIDAPSVCRETLLTHDVAEINDSGQFRILGRTDNIISSGGIKLSLDTLETRMGDLGVPYILTAVRDHVLGEALTLLYVPVNPDLSPDTLHETIAARTGHYERPRHIIAVSALPLTETGKPARATARSIAEKLVCTDEAR